MEIVLSITVLAFVAIVTTDTMRYRRRNVSKNR